MDRIMKEDDLHIRQFDPEPTADLWQSLVVQQDNGTKHTDGSEMNKPDWHKASQPTLGLKNRKPTN